MNEVKKPKKPLIYYYFIGLRIVMLFNLLVMPKIVERQIKETDYGTFMTMTEEQKIGRVEIQNNQILFTDKEETAIYKKMKEMGFNSNLKDVLLELHDNQKNRELLSQSFAYTYLIFDFDPHHTEEYEKDIPLKTIVENNINRSRIIIGCDSLQIFFIIFCI